ncbi:MAG: metallophosphoesterase family protein, partial [Candidatus Aenigmatarchaeota archaeon]
MESIERAFGIGPGGPNRETQPRRVNPDSPELIAREWQELNLARIREILTAEQDEWVKRVLSERLKKQGIDFESSPPEEKEKAREELIEELRQIKTREELLGKLKELQELGLDTTKIINLFGLVYIPDNYTVIAVTDIHGDINALEEAIGEFETIKGQGKNVAFVCMGDFVDRGDYNFEVVKRLFELKRKYQDEVIILKGDHEDDVFDIRIDKPYSIKIDGATFAELLFKYVQDRDEKIMELYVETFSKLPHAVMYRDILLTHAGIPVKVNFLEGENKCVIDEESIAIGRLIQPEKGDFREINWADIDPEIEEGVVKNIDRYHPEHLPPLNQIDLHKYSPKELTRILNQLGFSYFIRGHQYSYGEEGLLFETSPLAYRLFEESIITFHSNQSYYVNKRAYNEGCYLVLNPDGSIVAKGVEGGQERTIIQPKEEISQEQTLQAELTSEGTMEGETSSLKEGALKPQEAENQGGVEERELSSSERRELKFESLDDRIQVFI